MVMAGIESKGDERRQRGCVCIRLFGAFEVIVDSERTPHVWERRADRLLAYLTLRHRAQVSRAAVARALVPSMAEGREALDHAEEMVRQAEKELRRMLGRHGGMLESHKGNLVWDFYGAEVDVLAFERGMRSANAQDRAQALRLRMRGALLESWDDPWVIQARQELDEKAADMFESLAGTAADNGDLDAEIRYRQWSTRIRPIHVAGWRALISARIRRGEPGEAVRDYEKAAAALYRACGVRRPPQELVELYELAQSGVRTTPAPPADVAGAADPAGGALPLDSPYYIEREGDKLLRSAIEQRAAIVRIHGPRQVGKSSLLARGIEQAREAGFHVVVTDLQKLGARELECARSLYLALAAAIADALSLPVRLHSIWEPDRTPNDNFDRFIRLQVLAHLDRPILWAIEETDRLFHRDYRGEVFGLLRAWFNERAWESPRLLERLTLALVYATEAHLFIPNLDQSPFNVGVRIALSDFDSNQTAELNLRHGSPLKDGAELSRFRRLVGGNPYLSQRGLVALADGSATLAGLETSGASLEGPFWDHLHRLAASLERDAVLTEAVRSMLKGKKCTPESFLRLRAAGVAAGTGPADARMRCGLYETFFRVRLDFDG